MTTITEDSLLPALYGLEAMAHLWTNLHGLRPIDTITKCLLAPTLVLWIFQSPNPSYLLATALSCCFLGDLCLDLSLAVGDACFLGGMVSFAVAHVLFMRTLSWRMDMARLAKVLAPVVGITAVLLQRTWSGLPADLKLPVVVYAGLLGAKTAMALATKNLGVSGGAVVFMGSDALILLDVAGDPLTPQPPHFWVMVTYAVAIFLLAANLRNVESEGTLREPPPATDVRKMRD